MKCNDCTHNEVCKYKEYYIKCEGILKGYYVLNNLNPLELKCNFYDVKDKLPHYEPYVVETEYKIALNNGLYVYRCENLEELVKQCKNRLRKGDTSYLCYENILYSNGKIEIKKLPY